MKNISIQKEFGWCNAHTLANVFRDEDFKEFLSNEEFKSGSAESMSEMLELAGYSYYIHSLVKLPTCYPSINNEQLLSILLVDNLTTQIEGVDFTVTPYFLTVRLKGAKCWHSVAVLKTPKGLLYIDPYLEDVVVLKQNKDLFNHFERCIEVERVASPTKNPDEIQFICLKGAILGFDNLYAKEEVNKLADSLNFKKSLK